MTVTSWVKLTVSLWLLRRAVKAAWWLLLAAVAVALWPATLVMVAGYLAARWRGWPPARLRRAAAGIAARHRAVRGHGRSGASTPGGPPHWPRPGTGRAAGTATALAVARMFVLVSPVAVPAGLILAAGLWSWRNYAVSAGIGGRMPRPRSPSTTGSGVGRSAPPKA